MSGPKRRPAEVPLAVDLRDVAAGYRGHRALNEVTLQAPRGTMMAIVGPNGGGKSTLLKLLLGLLPPWTGEARVLGQRPSDARKRIGYVPQTGSGDWRFPATVGEVVMMGRYGRLGWLRRPGNVDWQLVRDALDRVGMGDRIDRQVGELSGGQQQRVFFARALVQEPELLLLDEPLAGVDALTERDIYHLLRHLSDRGVTSLLTTHNLSSVAEQFDLVAFVNRRIVAVGRPEDVFNEANLRATYGPRMALVRVGDRYYAIDVGSHAEVVGVGDA
ncbi:MAG: metal ABC transporter ATP-binding protein [Chloroflexi bacterium]|nr:metal ABC transporter ATP-binding protein [Chloroflexota bacterium]